jgi:Putative zinc-finger
LSEIPKSVQGQLARQQQTGASHPDPDLLTAFQEGRATLRERDSVERHLAICADCREVMFLATPAQEQAPASVRVTTHKARTRWFPMWGAWAATAVVLIGASFLVVRNQRGSNQTAQLQKAAPSETRVAPYADSQNTASAELKAPVRDKASDASSRGDTVKKDKLRLDGTLASEKESDFRQRLSEAPPSKDAMAKLDSRSRNDALADKSEAFNAPQPTPAVPSAAVSPSADYARRNTQLKPGPAAPTQNQMVQYQNQAGQNQIAQNQKVADQALLKSAPTGATETVEVTSAGAAPTQTSTFEAEIGAGAARSTKTISRRHWRISTDGNLESNSGAGTWTLALSQPGSRFTIVAIIGEAVWAGGTHGSLWRSVNNGASWTQISLPGITPGSDVAIAKIDFRDLRNGHVATDDHRSWTTTDGGATWRQP